MIGGITREEAAKAAAWYWRSRQFGITFTSPYSLIGEQFYSKLGLRQHVSVMCFEVGNGTGLDVTFSAELTEEGAVVGAVGAVLVLPVALAVGAVSYVEYENDAQRLLNDFWSYVSMFPSNQAPPSPAPSPSWADEQAAGVPGEQPKRAGDSYVRPAPVCPNCKATLDPDSRFCKYCGTSL